MRASERRAPTTALRVLLRLLPRQLRNDHGDSVLETFESAWQDRRVRQGPVAAFRFTILTALDLVATGARERGRKRGPLLGPGLGRDVRHAVRVLVHAPGFTASALLVLSLGIGVNAAIFTALRAVVLAGPPYPDADRLVVFGITSSPDDPGDVSMWSYPKLRLLSQMENARIEPIAGFSDRSSSIRVGEDSLRARLELVSQTYLPMLGANVRLGRLWTAEEEDPAAPQLVGVLSHAFWTSTFGGDPSVVGRTIPMGTRELRIVGVLEPSFEGLRGERDIWLPITAMALLYGPMFIESPRFGAFQAVGRLAPGATIEEARSWADAAIRHVETVYPPPLDRREIHAKVDVLRDARAHPEARVAVLAMAVAALIVLLVGCANLAGLQIARGAVRRHEIAVRTSLGATRAQLLRQLFVESLVLATVGGALGVGVAHYGLRLLRSQWPTRFGFDPTGQLQSFDLGALTLDPRALAFAAAVTVLTALLFGPLPALRLSGTGPAETLKSTSRPSSRGSASRLGARGALIAGEVALAFVLLVGATLITTTMVRLLTTERGFDTEGLLTFALRLPRERGSSEVDRFEAALQRIAQQPQVVDVAAGCVKPMSGHCLSIEFPLNGSATEGASQEWVSVGLQSVSERYFETVGARILAGRGFSDAGVTSAEPVVVINQAAADALFRDQDPIGRPFSYPGNPRDDEPKSATVIGVVENILTGRPQDGADAEAYVPPRHAPFSLSDMVVFVRTTADPEDILPVLTRELQGLEPQAAITDVETGADLLAAVTTDTRSVLWLSGLFAGAAVFLAALGIWSVVAYTVAQRTRELGIRMALGARAHQVVLLVARGGAGAAAVGVLLGVVGSFATTGLLSSLLFGVAPNDPAVYLIALLGFGGIGALASALPAMRATRVQPVQAIRSD